MQVIDLTSIKSCQSMVMAADYAVATAHYEGGLLVKFVVRSRFAAKHLRRSLREWKQKKRISYIIPGERYDLSNILTQYMINRFPDEANDSDIGAANPLITVVYIYS